MSEETAELIQETIKTWKEIEQEVQNVMDMDQRIEGIREVIDLVENQMSKQRQMTDLDPQETRELFNRRSKELTGREFDELKEEANNLKEKQMERKKDLEEVFGLDWLKIENHYREDELENLVVDLVLSE